MAFSKGTRKGGSRSRSRRSGGSSRSKVSKGKGSTSMRQITFWSQNASTKELQDSINEAARELALRADREEVD